MAEEVAAAAQAAYEAYSLAVGGRDPYHHPMEPYMDLHDVYKAAWEQAAMAAVGTLPVAAPSGVGRAARAETPAHPPAAATEAPAGEAHPPATKADVEDEEGESRPRGGRRG